MAVTIRKNDVKASNLFFLCLAISLLSFCLHLFELPIALSSILFTLALYPQLATIAVGVRAGQRWTKIVLVLVALLTIAAQLYNFASLSTIDMVLALVSIPLYAWSAGIVVKDLF